MEMDELKNITEVCQILDTTSRTVRYYEQCGLIKTTRKSKPLHECLTAKISSVCRKYDFLRKLGFSLEEIAGVIDSENQGKEADLLQDC